VPEGLEAEIWRRALSTLTGRRIVGAWVDERVAPPELPDVVVGERLDEVVRVGKVVVLETSGPRIGLHFGMTGRVEVDGWAPIEQLAYASGLDRPGWDRLRIETSPGSPGVPAVRFNDPRRLGRISLDPDLSALGPDALTVRTDDLRRALAGRRAPVKAMLLDQSVVAGLGNLCADEVLWWAGIDPRRPAGSLASGEVRTLAAVARRRLAVMLRWGGSTVGELSPEARANRPPCGRDGGELRRDRVAGRTTIWCPTHQT
jgi:formamidopyrimidine-DNA glycosylase